uniref:Uncharacterized protein n=1 Tax=Anguilla anguilla TaxID=7936 RepID=A0A0E9WCP4_ANGAN
MVQPHKGNKPGNIQNPIMGQPYTLAAPTLKNKTSIRPQMLA